MVTAMTCEHFLLARKAYRRCMNDGRCRRRWAILDVKVLGSKGLKAHVTLSKKATSCLPHARGGCAPRDKAGVWLAR